MITDNLTTAVYFSDLLPKKCPTLNQHIAEVLEANGIPYAYLSETKDIWCRDYMPVQTESGKLIQFKYDPSYLKGNKEWEDSRSDVEDIFFAFSMKLISSFDLVKIL